MQVGDEPPHGHPHTLFEMRGGPPLDTAKHSGGRYQYVPAPCDVSSMDVSAWPPSGSMSMILDSPKSVTFTMPMGRSNRMLAGFKS